MLSVLTFLRGRTPPFGSKGFPFAFPGRSHDTRRDARTFRTELVEVRQRNILLSFDAVCEPRHRTHSDSLFVSRENMTRRSGAPKPRALPVVGAA